MNLFLLRHAVLGCLLFLAQPASALIITAPQENQVVDAGSSIDVIVRPDAGEQWAKVLLAVFPMSYNTVAGEYKETIEIPKDALGNVAITVLAVDQTGREVELQRNIIAKLPPNVVLQSISVNKKFMLLYKLPAGSAQEDIQRIESRQLSVSGVYSDGVERELTAGASGTIYKSSNEKVVTVSLDGKVTAQGFGNTTITVKNDKLSAKVDIVVKTYRQPQK